MFPAAEKSAAYKLAVDKIIFNGGPRGSDDEAVGSLTGHLLKGRVWTITLLGHIWPGRVCESCTEGSTISAVSSLPSPTVLSCVYCSGRGGEVVPYRRSVSQG